MLCEMHTTLHNASPKVRVTVVNTIKIRQLHEQGVEVPMPATVYIGADVVLERIMGPETILFPGTRLLGEKLQIMPGCRIGEEGPATLDDCSLAPGVALKAGYFKDSTFLNKSSVGLGAHVRPGTLLEEQASGAHTVGLKQTILMPFVTLGSLINFCDILMAGGTSRRDHSEVGSSFIHFNFTPHGSQGDKATASLIGDVPRGVMLRSRRIFLGGQAGLVGPVSIDYGTVLAAGHVYRQNHGPDELVMGERFEPFIHTFNQHRFLHIRDRIKRNLCYIGNLIALWHWYKQIRIPLAAHDEPLRAVYEHGQHQIAQGIAERVKQLGRLADYADRSIQELEKTAKQHTQEIATQRAFLNSWPEIEDQLKKYQTCVTGEEPEISVLKQELPSCIQESYIEMIQSLPHRAVVQGTNWLQSIVDWTVESTLTTLRARE